MILLFKDYGTDYWIKNKIVDCGLSEYNQQLNIDIKLPDDEITNDEITNDEITNDEITNDEITNENNSILVEEENIKKKLNVKYKTKNSNKSRYEDTYIGRNSETIDENSRKKKFGNKFEGINNIQKTVEPIYLSKYINVNYYKKKVH